MIAALFLRHDAAWRSTQLALTFSLPPTNHFASGSFQSSTFCHGAAHDSAPAISAQKPSGSAAARAYSASYSAKLLTCAWLANSAGGGKLRFSVSTDSIDDDMASTPLLLALGLGRRVARVACRLARRAGG